MSTELSTDATKSCQTFPKLANLLSPLHHFWISLLIIIIIIILLQTG